jgi:hypothetical protein
MLKLRVKHRGWLTAAVASVIVFVSSWFVWSHPEVRNTGRRITIEAAQMVLEHAGVAHARASFHADPVENYVEQESPETAASVERLLWTGRAALRSEAGTSAHETPVLRYEEYDPDEPKVEISDDLTSATVRVELPEETKTMVREMLVGANALTQSPWDEVNKEWVEKNVESVIDTTTVDVAAVRRSMIKDTTGLVEALVKLVSAITALVATIKGLGTRAAKGDHASGSIPA